jgi:hypothetical protein
MRTQSERIAFNNASCCHKIIINPELVAILHSLLTLFFTDANLVA